MLKFLRRLFNKSTVEHGSSDAAATTPPDTVKKFYVQRVGDGYFLRVDDTAQAWVGSAEEATDFGSTEAASDARRYCPYVTRMFDLTVTVQPL